MPPHRRVANSISPVDESLLNNRFQPTARLKAFRVPSGAEVWRRKVPGLEHALVLGRKVIVSYRGTDKASTQAGLRAFDLASGRPLWHREFPVPPPGLPGVALPKEPASGPSGPRGQSKPRSH